MNTFEINDSKKDSKTLLLIFTGIILVSGLNLFDKFLGQIILLISSVFNFTFEISIYYPYLFQILLIFGLIYVMITVLKAKKSNNGKIPFYLKSNQLIWLGVFVIALALLNRILEYSLSDINNSFLKYSFNYSASIIHPGLYFLLNVLNTGLPLLKGILVMIIFFVLIKD